MYQAGEFYTWSCPAEAGESGFNWQAALVIQAINSFPHSRHHVGSPNGVLGSKAKAPRKLIGRPVRLNATR
jgi:hypothetical protein